MIAFFLDFFWLIVAIGLCVPTFYYLDEKRIGKSSFFMILSMAALAWFYWDELKSVVAAYGFAKAVLSFIFAYLIGGVLTSFIYWISYCWRVKDRLDEVMAIANHNGTTSMLTVLNSETSYIFDHVDGIVTFPHRINAVEDVLPPRFKMFKPLIIWAGSVWPFTILWLIGARIVKQLFNRIISMFGGTFDAISKWTFGNITP